MLAAVEGGFRGPGDGSAGWHRPLFVDSSLRGGGGRRRRALQTAERVLLADHARLQQPLQRDVLRTLSRINSATTINARFLIPETSALYKLLAYLLIHLLPEPR